MSGLTSSNMARSQSGWNASFKLAPAAERPQQLDDLLRVPPSLARPGAVAEPVQGFADLHVRFALPPQFDGLGDHTGEDNADAHLKRQVMGREVVVAITKGKLDFGPWEQIFYGEFDGHRPKRVLVKILGE